MRALLCLLAAALALAPPARAQSVTSERPDGVTVTIYRDPDRAGDDSLDLRWLRGYALITERRTVAIPAGRAVIRFEGVAGGILPESAIIEGLPEGVREKNLDADLLSARSLYAHSLGRPVTVRRTIGDHSHEERAIIRAGPDGGAILETRDGFEAVDCGPYDEGLLYPEVPAGLSAKPTLSVETESPAPATVTLTLAYLAWGFDWQANYVATLRPDGAGADLFAWVTLASSDVTSFPDAQTMVIAGKPNREQGGGFALSRNDTRIWFRCFPNEVLLANAVSMKRNSDSVVDAISAEDIGAFPDRSVTEALQRIPGVRQEELGDLKLYRVPEPTTVASMSQKQVMLLDKPAVPVEIYYHLAVVGEQLSPMSIKLRAQNREARGLGLPLPAGPVAVFDRLGGRSMLVGEAYLGDKSINEEVDLDIAASAEVAASQQRLRAGRDWQEVELRVSNAHPHPVRLEVEFFDVEGAFRVERFGEKLGRKNGHPLWSVEIPANSVRTLRYRLVQPALR